jgi:gamma-glutamylcyclotransferase (GGCT)/AIG2-like uncharacterized protein YtfP
MINHGMTEEDNIRPNPLLFVYGTLLSKFAHPMGERLRGEATLIDSAVMQARLYKVSWYPGAVSSDEPSDCVIGEIYRLNDPIHSLAWLDEYEGIMPAKGIKNPTEYTRTEHSVRVARGGKLTAWVYLYQGDVTRLARIINGRWAP